jgi:hypothetical protein
MDPNIAVSRAYSWIRVLSRPLNVNGSDSPPSNVDSSDLCQKTEGRNEKPPSKRKTAGEIPIGS